MEEYVLIITIITMHVYGIQENCTAHQLFDTHTHFYIDVLT